MKIRNIALALASVAMFTSCDMNLEPQGSIVDTDGLQTYSDVYGFRNSLYIATRALTTSSFYPISELQCDMFNGIILNGNRNGTIANGNINSADSDIEGYYSALYTYIAYCNYLLQHAPDVQQSYLDDGDTETAQLIDSYIAEAHFFRGYFYAVMFDRFCPLYTSDLADKNYGVCIQTEYSPTADRSKYPGRSTMNETIAFIQGEFDMALKAMLEYEAEGHTERLVSEADNISSNAIKAMQARFALWIEDYNTAYTKAKEVIDTKIYPLSGSQTLQAGGSWKKVYEEYLKMWVDDSGTEIIFMPYESTNELGGSYGGSWLSTYISSADYIPTSTLVDMLKELGGNATLGYNDVRYGAFLNTRNLDSAFGKTTTPCFNKFPGNPALQLTSALNLKNKAKVFRTSELYLIAAEAALNLNQLDNANALMNEFLKYRIKNYQAQTLNSGDLTNLIRDQRCKELVGEGFRLSDLRRWKLGFNRSNGDAYANSEVNSLLVASGLEVTYSSDDHRYTWPIPASEFTTNPQMTVQNPGY